MEAPNAPPARRNGFAWTCAAIVALVLLCYWPALRGEPLWDDDAHITRPELRSLSGLWEIWFNLRATQQYYPLLHSAFWLEHGLWGDATAGYHLVNVLLHALAAILFAVVLRRLGVRGAWIAGILFAVHPVCVESVAWISEQKNTLSLVFYLLAALAYLRFDERRGGPGAGRAYAAASALFAAALATKTVTATLPAALLVVAWWGRGSLTWRRDAMPLLPWLAAGMASGLFTSWVERAIGGAEGAPFDLSLTQRCLLAGRVVWFYLGKLAWPANLVFIYPRWDVRASAVGWIGFLVAAVVLTAVLWVLRRRSRGPLAAWLLFVGSLFPALGFFNVYPFLFSYVADHFQYLASLPVIALAAAGLAWLLDRPSQAARGAGIGLGATLVALFTLASNAQSATYADPGTLYRTTLERNPGCWMAHNNLGVWFKDRGNRDQAVVHYREALRLRPDYPQAHNNLGVWLEERGELDPAIAEYREAVRLKPSYVAAHINLGSAIGKTPGRLAEATAQFREALDIQPDSAAARVNLGTALLRTPGHLHEAISQFEAAVRLTPGDPLLRADLGSALSNLPERMDEAIAQYEEALRLKPDFADAHNNLGLALDSQGRSAEAVEEFEEALRLTPGIPEIRLNIASALLHIPGRENEAAAQLEAYLQARPNNEQARQVLAQIRSGQR